MCSKYEFVLIIASIRSFKRSILKMPLWLIFCRLYLFNNSKDITCWHAGLEKLCTCLPERKWSTQDPSHRYLLPSLSWKKCELISSRHSLVQKNICCCSHVALFDRNTTSSFLSAIKTDLLSLTIPMEVDHILLVLRCNAGLRKMSPRRKGRAESENKQRNASCPEACVFWQSSQETWCLFVRTCREISCNDFLRIDMCTSWKCEKV